MTKEFGAGVWLFLAIDLSGQAGKRHLFPRNPLRFSLLILVKFLKGEPFGLEMKQIRLASILSQKDGPVSRFMDEFQDRPTIWIGIIAL